MCFSETSVIRTALFTRCAWRRLLVRSQRVGAEEDAVEKVHGILGSGKRDVREIERLGRSWRWTEDGLECEASDEHRQASLEGLGLNGQSKTVNSAEEIGQDEDASMLDEVERKKFRSLTATLDHVSLDRSDARRRYARRWRIRHKGARELEETEQGRQTYERSGKSDVGDVGTSHDEMKVDVHVDSD